MTKAWQGKKKQQKSRKTINYLTPEIYFSFYEKRWIIRLGIFVVVKFTEEFFFIFFLLVLFLECFFEC